MRFIRVTNYIGRFILAAAVGLTLFGFSLPPVVQAANPVDLELGGAGATAWNITNIEPSDTGTSTVELRNIGTLDGFVSVWVSEIISTEGLNPESETGDKSDPGELGAHLLLDLTADGLRSNLALPVTFNELPRSVSSSDFIEVIPIKAGQTVNLQWQWNLPYSAGNDIQGDSLSFTLNYLLRECILTDVTAVVDVQGVFTDNVTAVSDTTVKAKVEIKSGTKGTTAANQTLSDIWIIEIENDPLPPPVNNAVASQNYEAGPEGTTFDQPVTITLQYDPASIPDGISESQLFISVWDENTRAWVAVPGSTVNLAEDTVSAPVTHFSRYTVLSPDPPPPPPPTGGGGDPGVDEPVVVPPSTPGSVIDINMLNYESAIEIEADGTLKEKLTLNDINGNFVIEIDAGTRMTGAGGVKLSRIDLRTIEGTIPLPENITALGSVYELVGYTSDAKPIPISFDPPALITIRYDWRNLPDNSFLPFIASYTDEQGFLRLSPPEGSIVETGKASATINNLSYFAVVAEVAPPPPPLPPLFRASALTVSPEESFVGDEVNISITIANDGDTWGTFELHLIVDGIVRTIEEVILPGKSKETLTFEISNLSAGSHQVEAAGLSSQFKVEKVDVSIIESSFNWVLLDSLVAGGLAIGAVIVYLYIQRARRTRLETTDRDRQFFVKD